jgi:transcription antitermination factor NusG
MTWFVLAVAAGAESRISEKIAEKAPLCQPFYPKRLLWCKARGKNTKVRRVRRTFALMPGYLFVDVPVDVPRSAVSCCDSKIFGFVGCNGEASAIRSEEMARLFDSEASGEYDETRRIEEVIVGKLYEITEGALAGRTVKILNEQSGKLSVLVLGIRNDVKIPLSNFKKLEHREIG